MDCDSVIKYCKILFYRFYKAYDDWKNPPCKECGIKSK